MDSATMEDEDGYMGLNFQPRNGNLEKNRNQDAHRKKRPVFLESLCYNKNGIPTSFSHYKTSLWVLGAGCVTLGLTTIVLMLLVLQGRFCKGETVGALNATEGELGILANFAENCPSSQDAVARLRNSLCGPPADHSVCKLCPFKWTPLKGRCYWFSEGTKRWPEAQEHCARVGAHLLVIQDLEMMEFVPKNNEEEYRFWVGLTYTLEKWTWADSSFLDQTLFPLSVPVAGRSCGVVQGHQIRSEMCRDEFKWVCEKEAALI